MTRTIVSYGTMLAIGAFGLAWVQYQFTAHLLTTEIYTLLIALFFAALGIWAGRRLVSSRHISAPFSRNDTALRELHITGREYQVLEQIAAGQSNKQVAKALGVSPNTVKTQISSLLTKLSAARRTEAILNARTLSLIP